jgi:hypothetical protein
MTDEPFGDLPAEDLPAGSCLYQEPWNREPCGEPATTHGISDDDESEACSKHWDVLRFHSRFIHPWTPACAEGTFVKAENRCRT